MCRSKQLIGRPPITRYCALVIVLIFGATGLSAQRHGRADSIQNYLRGGPQTPQLLFQVKVQGKRFYFRPAELRKMQRSVASIPDAATGKIHTYEGINLETLVSGMLSGNSGTIDVYFGARQNLTVSVTDLDPTLKPMIADTIDGKRLGGYAPYHVLMKTRRGNLDVIKNARQINVRLVN
jgi:hypothetical protein